MEIHPGHRLILMRARLYQRLIPPHLSLYLPTSASDPHHFARYVLDCSELDRCIMQGTLGVVIDGNCHAMLPSEGSLIDD